MIYYATSGVMNDDDNIERVAFESSLQNNVEISLSQ